MHDIGARMKGLKPLLVAAGSVALVGAQPASPLAQAQPGLWELSGVQGAKAPVRQCVADVASLVQFEHRGKTCKPRIVSSSGTSTVIEYTCGPANGFGRSEVEVITPRSLRIETQGISDQLPFRYVLQARRVGDCPMQATASRH
jgi:hypothetical protein